jgi:acyl-CoA synthetase
VAEAVVVSAPDHRLGERVVAVLHVRPGYAMPTLEEIREHFATKGVARQKWPEELHEASDFPRTASGKIQKTQVRRSIREMSAAEQGTGLPPDQDENRILLR